MEIWKDIKGYEGIYQISDTGIVKRLEHNIIRADDRRLKYKEKIVAQTTEKKGYKAVKLCVNCVGKTFKVHRLVAGAFLKNLNSNFDQVNHKDGDKTNNNVWNLEWIDQTGNINHSLYAGLRYTRKVECIETGEVFISTREAGRGNKSCHKDIIRSCKTGCQSKRKHFRYVS
jgi:hypothetical protein